MIFEYDAKFRAARAILKLTREQLSEMCGLKTSVIQRLETDFENVHSANLELLEEFFAEKGIIFGENEITITEDLGGNTKIVDYDSISDKEIMESFRENEVLNEKYSKWDRKKKSNFISVVRILRKNGLDFWNVNMNEGEIRSGSKGLDDIKGKPFFYMKFRDEGFTIDVNNGVKSYSKFIRKLNLDFGHGWFVDDSFVSNLNKISENGMELPKVIQSSCKGRLPTDYPSPYEKS